MPDCSADDEKHQSDRIHQNYTYNIKIKIDYFPPLSISHDKDNIIEIYWFSFVFCFISRVNAAV